MDKLRIAFADLEDPGLVDELFALLRASYAKEARLLGLEDFAPLGRERATLVSDGNLFLIASDSTKPRRELLGALELERSPGASGTQEFDLIAALVVSPAQQRRGIASDLVERALEISCAPRIQVSTARANLPALALYRHLGFTVQKVSSRNGIELVHLSRRVDPSQTSPESEG